MQTFKRKILASLGDGQPVANNKRQKVGEAKENVAPNVEVVVSSKMANKPADTLSMVQPEHEESSGDSQQTRIMGLKVVELRKELRELGLETTGLKRALQQRLIVALDDARRENPNEESSREDGNVEIPDESNKAHRMSTSSHEGKNEDEVKDSRMSLDEPSKVSNDEDESKHDVVSVGKDEKLPLKNFVKTTAKLFSPDGMTSKFQQPRKGNDVDKGGGGVFKSAMSPIAHFVMKSAATLMSPQQRNVNKDTTPKEPTYVKTFLASLIFCTFTYMPWFQKGTRKGFGKEFRGPGGNTAFVVIICEVSIRNLSCL